MTSGEDDCVQSPHMKIIPIPHSDIILPVAPDDDEQHNSPPARRSTGDAFPDLLFVLFTSSRASCEALSRRLRSLHPCTPHQLTSASATTVKGVD